MVHVAIIGGGIAGTTLGIALQQRNISFTIFEKVSSCRSVGAGIGFSSNASAAMKLISPALHARFAAIAGPTGDEYFRWVDGKDTDDVIYSLFMGRHQFRGCRRSDLLEGVQDLVKEHVMYGKEAVRVVEEGERVRIEFADKTVEEADIVIAADGIRSPIRHALFPASIESFTHKTCYRALLPMATAQQALSPARTASQHMYIGPNGHILTYPVANNTQLNLLIVLSDPADWDIAAHPRMTAQGSRAAVQAAFTGWTPTAHALIDLLPADADALDTWALYDLHEHPPARFCRGLVGLAGDAAHATGPHLGAGGGMGVEDALLLAELIKTAAAKETAGAGFSLAQRLKLALEIYSDARYDRTMRVIADTRQVVDWFHREDSGATTLVERDEERKQFGESVSELFRPIWEFDNAAEVEAAKMMMRSILSGEASYEIRV